MHDIEPLVAPNRSFTGDSAERVDTRVLQPVDALDPQGLPIHVGPQVDVFIQCPATDPLASPSTNATAATTS